MDTVSNAAAGVVNTAAAVGNAAVNAVQSTYHGAAAEGKKEEAKHGNTLGDKISGAAGYVEHKAKE